MTRRSFLSKLGAALASLAFPFRKVDAQGLPFGFWKTTGNTGTLRSTQAILAALGYSTSGAEARITQASVVALAGGGTDLATTQAIMTVLADGGEMRTTQMFSVVAAGAAPGAAEMRVTQILHAVAAGVLPGTAEVRTTQVINSVAGSAAAGVAESRTTQMILAVAGR